MGKHSVSRAENKTAKFSHTVPPGRTLINRIEAQIDRQRKRLETQRVEQGVAEKPLSPMSYEYAMWEQAQIQGRIEGMAATLAILRSSSVKFEIERSNERLEQ